MASLVQSIRPSVHPRTVVNESLRVSVCIPAHNEEALIAATIAEAEAVLDTVPGRHEILVVDDGSRDGTWTVLCEAATRHPLLRLLRHPERRGLAAAQQTLIRAVEGDVIFHIGADQEWRMDEIPRMLAKLREGYDVVIGVRRRKQYTLWRKCVSTLFNGLVALMWGKHFGDLGSLKMARADLWKRIPVGTQSAFANAERVLIAHHNGARISTIPVDHVARKHGRSKFAKPGQALRAFRDLVRFRLSARSRQRLRGGSSARLDHAKDT